MLTMFINFSRFLVVLTLFAVQSLAKSSLYKDFADYEEFDEWPRNIGVPGTPRPSLSPGACRKDILLILDMSSSITEDVFNKEVKSFLYNLIDNEDLNVGRNGTHIAVIVFSDDDQTKVKLRFGELTTKKRLKDYVDVDLDYAVLSRRQTRTDRALELADTEVFTDTSPKNARSTVDDVIILFTDGKPQGVPGTRATTAKDCAESLKKKKIAIVGIAAGNTAPEYKDDNPKDFIASLATSTNYTFNTTLSSLSGIVEKLVKVSCRKSIRTAQCTCGKTIAVEYLEHGKNTTKFIWEKPNPSCQKTKIIKTVVTPEDAKSRKSYEAGSHTITYKYTYQDGGEKTHVECSIELKAENCSCPSRVLEVQYAEPGKTAYVTWEVPEPSCTGDQVVHFNEKERIKNGHYGVGSHTIPYDYSLASNTDKIVAKCSVQFKVKDCKCPPKDLGVFSIVRPQDGHVCPLKPWTRPTPNCPVLPDNSSPRISGAGEKGTYAIGKHTVTYTYSVSNNLEVKCHVKLEMKVVECDDKEYDPDKKHCCYGKLHDKQNEVWKCCGTAYYDPKLHKCCDMENAYIVSKSGGECPNECASNA